MNMSFKNWWKKQRYWVKGIILGILLSLVLEIVSNLYFLLRYDIFNFRIMSPHQEMEEVITAKDKNTYFESAINTSTDFIVGRDFVFRSDDDFSQSMVEKWLKTVNFDLILREIVAHVIAVGNGYMEQDFLPLILFQLQFQNLNPENQFHKNLDDNHPRLKNFLHG